MDTTAPPSGVSRSRPYAERRGRALAPDHLADPSVGAHASMAGPYVILGFPSEAAMDVVLLDNPSGSMWLEGATEVETYLKLWNDVCTKALSAAESLELINSIKELGS